MSQHRRNASNSGEGEIQISKADFYFGATLGEGAFARVVHAKSKNSDTEFAIKIMEKAYIKKENKVKYVMMERNILAMISHPLMVKFHFSFQDKENLYMCMDLATGGELLSLIMKKKSENLQNRVLDQACDIITSRFYLAEIVEALEYLHNLRIVHRDLKPENILLAGSGHIKVTDFGTSIILSESDSSSQEVATTEEASLPPCKERDNTDNDRDSNYSVNSFVGTQDYVSPEVLSGDQSGVTKACDLWALGCILYQLLTGISPFRADTEYLCFMKINNHASGAEVLSCPSSMPQSAVDLIQKLLQATPSDRLGAGEDADTSGSGEEEAETIMGNGYRALKSHVFFATDQASAPLQWGSLHLMETPYKPVPMPPSKMRDGADDEWLFDLDSSPLSYAAGESLLDIDGEDEKERAWRGLMPMAYGKESTGQLRWTSFLREAETLVLTGLVYKRKGLFAKKRQLILTDFPRLLYIDPDTMELKGEIPWTKEHPVKCQIRNGKNFEVFCSQSGRTYFLADAEVGAEAWLHIINALVERDGATKPRIH